MPATLTLKAPTGPKRPAIGDDAVLAKTGRTWPQWFSLIDAAGGKGMDHKQIVAVVEGHDVPAWWRQMVAVTYEQSRGLREKHQTPAGYQVSVSRTFAASTGDLFRAWAEPRRRAKWLTESASITVRKATPGKSLRITWVDGTHVNIDLLLKGETKCQVTVDHKKLSDASSVTRMKKHWAAALERLANELTPSSR